MSKAIRQTCLGLLAAAVLCGVDAAQAQLVRVGRGAGVVVRAPYVGTIRVGVGPIVPGIIGVPGRPILPRRRFAAVPPVPTVVVGPAPRYLPGVTRATIDAFPPAAPQGVDRSFPTAEQLAAFDDGSLLNAVLDIMAQLDADVGQFDTGATWQRYFRLPDDALPPPSRDGHVVLGFNSIKSTLDRLDSVAANPEYPMISGLPSFAAAQLALAEVVNRFGAAAGQGGVADARTGAEELPAPTPTLAAPANAASGERSILAR